MRRPIEQFLRVVRADHSPAQSEAAHPFQDWAPGFFEHLRKERGLSPTTVAAYGLQLARFEQYLVTRHLTADALSAVVLDEFIAQRRVHVCARPLGSTCAALRALLRYLACHSRGHVLLTGEPGVGKTCVLRALRHRLDDTAEYLQHRLGRAGADASLFSSDAIAMLHEASVGRLRDIDRIATDALKRAARRKLKKIAVLRRMPREGLGGLIAHAG